MSFSLFGIGGIEDVDDRCNIVGCGEPGLREVFGKKYCTNHAKMVLEGKLSEMDIMMRTPYFLERSAANLIRNVVCHVGAFISDHVGDALDKKKPRTTAIDMVRDMKVLIKEYEDIHGVIK